MKDVRPARSRDMLRRHALWAALTLAIGLPQAHAQVNPDGTTRTQVQKAPNGVPVVDIAAPNQRGVSHNRYQRFDVAGNGLILNNSGTIANTQLAGYVNGNANFSAGQRATLILNEVTSTLPSHLGGVIEVAGPGAQVVVANPNGIECSGCGFINTPRGMLTTGRPVLAADGSLGALRVTGGSITVDGQGLDGSAIDRLDLVARTVAVNAGVWARQLNVVTGANQVDYATLTPHALGADPAPAVALDVSALGGMYAGVIRLIGTEAGVGVNNRGRIAAQAGNLTLTSAGDVVTDGTLSASGALAVDAAQGLRNLGTIASGGAMALSSGAGLESSGTLYSGGDMKLAAAGPLHNGGEAQAQGTLVARSGDTLANDAAGRFAAGGAIDLAGAAIANAGQLEALQGIRLSATGKLTNDGSVQADGGSLVLRADALDNRGKLYALDGALDAQLTHAFANAASGDTYASAGLSLQAADASNAGQLQSGGAIDIAAAGFANSARVQAGGALGIHGGHVDNDADGLLLAGGDLTLDVAQSLANAGTLQAGQSLFVQGAGGLDNDGLLYTGHGLVLDLGGQVANAGTLYGATGASLTAGGLDNTGALRSGGVLALLIHGDAGNAGSAYATGESRWNVDGTLDNTGTLASAGDTTVQSGVLASTGTLAAGLQARGSLAGSGLLQLDADGTLASHGRAYASGDLRMQGGQLDLGGSQTRVGGDATLTATAGDIDNRAGDFAANGRIDLAAQRLVNGGATAVEGGLFGAAGWNLHLDDLDNRYGTLSQSGGDDFDLALAGSLRNAHGTLAANAGNLTVQAGAIDNQYGTIQHAGSGTLTLSSLGDLDDTGGILAGNGALALAAGGALRNAGGQIGVARGASIAADGFDNSDGQLVADGIDLAIAHALSNAGGTMQSGGGFDLLAGSLANAGGYIKATGADALSLRITGTLDNGAGGFIGGNGDVSLQGGSLANAGQVYAGQALRVDSDGAIDNDDGALQAQGALEVSAGGKISNRNGKLEAGAGDGHASLALAATSVDNSHGRIANAGDGATTLATGAMLNQGGTLGGQGDVTLAASSLDNTASGHLVAGRDLLLQLGGLSNAGGTVYAARDIAWNRSGAQLVNGTGSFGAGGGLALTLASIDNAGGDLAATGDITLDLGNLTGAGRIVAGQDLSLSLDGGLTNARGNQLKANRDLSLTLGGNFSNQAGATLEAVRKLTLHAANIANASGASFDSAATTLSATGTLDNAGRIEGDQLTLSAGTLDNTGTIIGDTITATATNLTNGADLGSATGNAAYQSGLIAATDSIALYVRGTLLNRDATIFTTGDLTLAANAALGRSSKIINRSGDIEADGNITLAATQFTNERRVFQTQTHVLTATEQAQNSRQQVVVRYRWDDPDPTHRPPYVDAVQVVSAAEIAAADAHCGAVDNDHYRCRGYPYGVGSADTFQATLTDTVVSVERLAATSAQGRLLAGGDIRISGSVRNDKSTIAAGNNLVVNGEAGGGSDSVVNIAWVPTAKVQRNALWQVGFESESHSDSLCAPINGGSRCWVPNGYETYDPWGAAPDLSAPVPTSLAPGKVPGWIHIAGGDDAPASITAGHTVSITARDISNSTVGADGKPVRTVIGLGSNGDGAAVTGGHAGPVGSVGHGGAGASTVGVGGVPASTVPPGGSGALQTVPDAGISLPQSGLYTIHSDPSSPYLIETDPRFTSYTSFISSDYLLDRLHVDGSAQHKRLGDGFYEQRQVLDQIAQLTGLRFLSDDSDALAQYRSLMDAGVQAAGAFDLSVGVALTGEQMAALTQDMVWLVDKVVDGQHVLVPVVYLSADHAKTLAAQGATIAGKNVVLNASGDIDNQGRIAASQSAQLTASNLLNSGGIQAGNDLSISAAQDILNGGTLKAGGNVGLVAGRDVRSGADAAMALGAVDLSVPGLLPNVAAPTPGGITAGGSLAIAAGRDLTLGPAPVHAGRDLSLAAGRDLSLQTTAVSAGGDAQLLAGRDLELQATGHTVGQRGANYDHTDTTRFATASVNAGGNLVLAAGRDLQSQGAQLDAGGLLAASAGRDLSLQAVSDVDSSVAHHAEGRTAVSEGHRDETLRGTSLSGGQGVILSAGHDLLATAAMVDGGKGAVALGAGHDVVLDAGQESHTTTRDTQRHHHGLLSSTDTTTHDASTDTLAIGTTLSGASVAIAAGHDLTTHGAQVLAEGDVGLSAGHDVLLGAAYDTHGEEHDRSTVKRGGGLGVLTGTSKGDLFTRTHTTQHDASTDTVAIGSLVSGDRVTIAAGHDLTTQASQIAGTHDVVLAAGHDLVLGTADSTHSEEHDLKVNTYGAQRNGLHGMFGVAKAKQTATETDVTPTGSLVGSTDGSVTLSAGQDVRITGSDVLSQTGTAIVGQNVTIEAAVGTVDGHQTQSLHTGGIMAGLTGGAASAAEQTWASGQAAGRASDKRLKALYAAQAAYGAYDAYKGGANGVAGSQGSAVAGNRNMDGSASASGAQGAANASGTSLRIGIGASSASAHSDTHDDIAYASHIRSVGNVTIAATNGDLNVIGSDIAGQNVALAASHDLNLLSQAEQHTQKDSAANASGEVGISIGSTTGIYVSAAGGLARAHGNGETHATSSVTASDTLSLISGNDTTIQGAQARGNTVLAGIGGDLNLASEQDTDDYASKQTQAGVTLVYGFSGGGVGVSGNLAYGQMDSDYASVTQVGGIAAGDGGYSIHVGGNTDLKGAVIASSADPSRNLLSTGTLSYSDIENQAHYDAFSVNVSGGYGSSGGSFSAGGSIPQNKSDSSTTRAGIAQGTIEVRDGGTDLSGLDRNPDIDAEGLEPIFDQQKVAQQQEMGQVATQVGMRSVGALADHLTQDYEDAYVKANNNRAALANPDLSAEQRQALETDLTLQQSVLDANQSTYDYWKDGGTGKVLLHGMVGVASAVLGGGKGLQGGLGATAGEAAGNAMREYLTQQGIAPDSAEGRALMDLASAAIGGATGGGSGASTSLAGEQYNRQLHPSEIAWLQENGKAYAQAQCHCDNPSDAAIQAATQELTQQALRQVDTKWAELVGEQDNPAAKAWLAANAPSGTVGYSNDAYFAATEAERNNPYIYFGSLDQNTANREFVQWAAGIGKSGLASNAQGVGVGVKDSVVGAVHDLWNLGQAIGSTDVVDLAKQSAQQWELLLTDPNGYADAVKQQASAGVDAIAQAAAQGYVDAKLDSLYGGYSGSAAVMTFGLFQVLNPEEKVAVLAQLSKEGKVAKLAELEKEAAQAGKLDEFKAWQSVHTTSTQSAPKITIKDHYDHHLTMVDDVKDQLLSQGYSVSNKEISFGSSCGGGRCRPDIVAKAPDGSIRIIEVKTGGADLSIRQSEIFPQIRDGNSIPRGRVAEEFGLIPGRPLKDQGYPNGIPVEVINFPGAKK